MLQLLRSQCDQGIEKPKQPRQLSNVLFKWLYSSNDTSRIFGAPKHWDADYGGNHVELGLSWMDPYIAFLFDGTLPNDVRMAKKVRRTSAWYWLSKDKKLYWRLFRGPYLLCLHPCKTTELLIKLYGGICCIHLGGRSLAHQAITQGFWWPNMQWESIEYEKRYGRCIYMPQWYTNQGKSEPSHQSLVICQWGLDIIGLFPRTLGNRRYVIVATDYFRKWVEAKALANIKDIDVKKFVWKNIITRFGVPRS